jgi:hypothetical protein
VADPIEQFNQHQMDVKTRLNFLVQCVLLLAGGALTASIAVFTGSRTVELSNHLSTALAFSWWSLVGSICSAVVVVSIVILRDYHLAEQWRKQLRDPSHQVNDSPGWPDFFIILLGILSLVAFLAGFVGIAYVATGSVVA